MAANAGLQALSTTGIFVISGLGLKRGEAASAATAWGSVLFGMVSVPFQCPFLKAEAGSGQQNPNHVGQCKLHQQHEQLHAMRTHHSLSPHTAKCVLAKDRHHQHLAANNMPAL